MKVFPESAVRGDGARSPSSPEDIVGLVCPKCRTDIVIQSVRNSSHTLIWHAGRLAEGCDETIRRTFRFPSLNILASDLLSYEAARATGPASPLGNSGMKKETP